MHVSLDGFVAGPKGEMNWINANEEVFEVASEATARADTAMYGRVTYDMMNSYWPTAGNQPGQAGTTSNMQNGITGLQKWLYPVR